MNPRLSRLQWTSLRRLLALACLAFLPCSGRTAQAAEPIGGPLVVGHRGLLQAAPENTLAGFGACLALRVGFEFDVRRTRDGELVCVHDATVERTTGGRGRVADLTLAEIRGLDAGSWYDAAFRGERVPTIEEIFDLVAEHGSDATLIAVDVKQSGDGIEEALVKMAQERRVLDRLVFIGLAIESAEVRGRLKASSAEARVARLAPTAETIDEVLRDTTADWVYVRFLPASADIAKIHAAGKRAFIAGPLVAGNEPENWSQAARLGIDGILTDYPLELRKQLRRR